jgi:hypothetical protein
MALPAWKPSHSNFGFVSTMSIRVSARILAGVPYPGCFCERVRKELKIKELIVTLSPKSEAKNV